MVDILFYGLATTVVAGLVKSILNFQYPEGWVKREEVPPFIIIWFLVLLFPIIVLGLGALSVIFGTFFWLKNTYLKRKENSLTTGIE